MAWIQVVISARISILESTWSRGAPKLKLSHFPVRGALGSVGMGGEAGIDKLWQQGSCLASCPIFISFVLPGFPWRQLPHGSSAAGERLPPLVPPRLAGCAGRALHTAGSPPCSFGPMDVHTPHMAALVILLTHPEPVKPVESRTCEITEHSRKKSHPSTFVWNEDLSTEASQGQGADVACPRHCRQSGGHTAYRESKNNKANEMSVGSDHPHVLS